MMMMGHGETPITTKTIPHINNKLIIIKKKSSFNTPGHNNNRLNTNFILLLITISLLFQNIIPINSLPRSNTNSLSRSLKLFGFQHQNPDSKSTNNESGNSPGGGSNESGESKEFSRHLKDVLRDERDANSSGEGHHVSNINGHQNPIIIGDGHHNTLPLLNRTSKQFDPHHHLLSLINSFSTTSPLGYPICNGLFNLQFSGLADLLRRPSDDSCPSCTCGASHREERIVGGSVAEVNSYPWLAALQYRHKFYCGGALISNRYILTAAHCVHGVPKDQITIVLGEHDRNETDESLTQYRKIASFERHPEFQRATFNNDIAVLRMDRPIRFNKYISPACLPIDYEDEEFDGETGMVAGWGRTEEKGKPSHILREVPVPIMTNEECTKTKYTTREITGTMMCAGYPNGKLDACQGDSGGPLNWEPNDSKDIRYVIGIVSWGQGCARAGYPGVYTRITKYLEWIRLKTLDSCFCSIPER